MNNKRLSMGVISLICVLAVGGCGLQDRYLKDAEKYMDLGLYGKAVEEYKKAIKAAPEDENIYMGIIEACMEAGDRASAVEYLEQAEEKLTKDSYEGIVNDLEQKATKAVTDVYMAYYSAITDPEVICAPGFEDEYRMFLEEPHCFYDIEKGIGPIEDSVLQTLGLEKGVELFDRIIISDENDPKVMIYIGRKYTDLKVYIKDHDEYVYSNIELTSL